MHKHPPVDMVPRFKFFKTWSSFDSCEKIISDHWCCPISGTPMHILNYKLKTLKVSLRNWNKEVVGDLHQRIVVTHKSMENIQLIIDQLGMS